jgi:hypothetical protein
MLGKFVLGIVSVLGLLGLAKVASAKQGTGGTSLPSGKDPAERVASALASGDAATMRRVADALDAEGFHDAAKDLRDAAARVDAGAEGAAESARRAKEEADAARRDAAAAQARKEQADRDAAAARARGDEAARREAEARAAKERAAKDQADRDAAQARADQAAATTAAKEQGVPVTQLPEVVVTPGGGGEDPTRALAQRLTDHLRGLGGLSGRGHENQALVSAYQAQEGLNTDGKYGPGTAKRILVFHGLVPVVPYYWSKSNFRTQKKEFSDAVRTQASGDPSRADQYAALLRDVERS